MKVGEALADVARRVLALPSCLESGMWYTHDYLAFAKRQGRVPPLRRVIPGATPGTHFERPRGAGLYTLRLRRGQSAREALQGFLWGPTMTDCGAWVQALMYATLLRAWGTTLFERRFGGAAAEPLVLGSDEAAPLQPWCRSWAAPHLPTIAVGDVVYFAGVPGYARKHPLGVAQGWHTICCDVGAAGPLLAGLGISTPLPATAIEQHLVDEYNAPRTWSERGVAWCRPLKHGLRRHGLMHRVIAARGMVRVLRLHDKCVASMSRSDIGRG